MSARILWFVSDVCLSFTRFQRLLGEAFEVRCSDRTVLDSIHQIRDVSIVIVDHHLADAGAHEGAAHLRFKDSQTRLILMVHDPSELSPLLLRRPEFDGFFLAGDSDLEIQRVVESALKQEVAVSALLQPRYEECQQMNLSPEANLVVGLTLRQYQVFLRLGAGYSVKSCAAAIFLAPKAISAHAFRIMSKLGLHDRLAICRWAVRLGLLRA